jgi:hypothetical protein
MRAPPALFGRTAPPALVAPPTLAGASRRAVLPLFAALLAPIALPDLSAGRLGMRPALAADLLAGSGSLGGYSWRVPTGWEAPQTQSMPDGRRLVIAADPLDPDFNVFFATTPIQADYSSLGSFGNLDYVGTTFLPQCPVGLCTLERDGIAGQLLSQSSSGGGYTYEYSIQQQGQPSRRLRTLMLIQTEEGRGKNIVTLTAQCKEARAADLAPTLKAVVDSLVQPGK